MARSQEVRAVLVPAAGCFGEIARGERAFGVLFLLRSIFWLSVVFTSMSWTVGGDMQPGSSSAPRAFGDAVAESGAAMAHAARQVAMDQIETHIGDGAGDKTTQLVEKAAFSYLVGQGSNQAPLGQAVMHQAREWCVKSDDVCARDAARLTALFVANQFDEADAFTTSNVIPSAPKHRAAVRVTAR